MRWCLTDEQSAFNINGLEIDLDELDAFERKVAEKKGQQMVGTFTPADAPDYLDEYLERLQISRQEDETKEADKNKNNNINNENSVDMVPLQDQPVSRYSFIRLLLLFMSLVSMAKLLKYGNWPKTRNNNNNTFKLQRPLCLNFRNSILINLFFSLHFNYRRGR